MQLAFTAADIAAITEAKDSRGSTQATIRNIAGLADAETGDLSFLGNTKYKTEVPGTRASVVLLPKDFAAEPRPDQLFLYVENPSIALARICARMEQSLWPKPSPGIHPSAVIAAGVRVPTSATIGPLCVIEEGAMIGERTHLQAQVFIGRNTVIGEDCWLMPGVIVGAECRLGQRVRLQPGVVVGADGFGYEFAKGHWEKLPQVGTVIIENDVEIGANSSLDRARFSRTVVGEGTKIDNLVQVGHNVIIGRHCMICAQTGISGSTSIEDFVVLGGQVGVAGHITVGRGAKVGGQAGINGDVEPGLKLNGTPAIPYNLERRVAILQRRLPDLFKRVDSLEAQLLGAKKSSS